MKKTLSLQFLLQLANIANLLVWSFLLAGCEGKMSNEDQKNVQSKSGIKNGSKRANLNLSILVDLSDRISPTKYPNATMDYYKRDLGYINSICAAFTAHLESKKIITMDDRIQAYFDPPPASSSINELSKKLKFHISRKNASTELLAEVKIQYPQVFDSIYRLTIKDNKYVGSDTWNFFKNKLSDYCIQAGYKNILVVLTDGYMYHKNTLMKINNKTSYLTPEDIRKFKLNTANWENMYKKNQYGFIPASQNIKDIDILLVGINPNPQNPYEGDVIVRYWTDWFKNMGLDSSNFSIKTAELPSDLDMVIRDFLSKRSQAE